MYRIATIFPKKIEITRKNQKSQKCLITKKNIFDPQK